MFSALFDYEDYDETDFMEIQFCECVLKRPLAEYSIGDKFSAIVFNFEKFTITFYPNNEIKEKYEYKFDLNIHK